MIIVCVFLYNYIMCSFERIYENLLVFWLFWLEVHLKSKMLHFLYRRPYKLYYNSFRMQHINVPVKTTCNNIPIDQEKVVLIGYFGGW